MAAAAPGCDTTDMRMVHRVFRRELGLLPALVAAVPPGDVTRARRVARHAEEHLDALAHHHHGEGELLWPPLMERADLDPTLLTKMRDDHDGISRLLDEAAALLPSWSGSADTDSRNRLVSVLERAAADLAQHLDEEEQRVLPTVERCLTRSEWAEIGRRGMASIPPPRRLVFLGHILEEASPTERRAFLSTHVPAPVRVAYRLIGARQHRRETVALRGSLALRLA